MQFSLDKNQKSTLLEQAREQLLVALHTGKVHAGDRLPSVRQVVLHSNINIKTAPLLLRWPLWNFAGCGQSLQHILQFGAERARKAGVVEYLKSLPESE